ncbi:MAG: tRNA (N6-threonylcarbamoyladenosine(37)-N6)-methyltransferase TrmO [Candidatus Aminicenantes bacterium RBG_16_63_14]|nr:MAG: tRNA (N6-threonylcarbamoyladenosine(37)-N6)-methyltransferase TrmO [Candidatus Aminicenantes bacterium RBG_16_63_14]OGD26107.1 MAG: tRNA (N6-threonylcarbamoyladenosine(37)-N6)-methyltransferase TrmO [Candidatus Aminicenantes bacterium RBG_19FT_COMBO_65_30]
MADVRQGLTRGLRFRPIGTVRSRFKEPADLPPPAFAPPRFFERSTGEIEVDPEFAEALDDIEGFSHIIVLFHFHRSGGAKLKAVPPGEPRPRGIFSTRSPHRPNPLGLSVLKLLGRDGRVLKVSGLDIIDGTPVLDIKPYTSRDRKSHIRTGWLQKNRRPAR